VKNELTCLHNKVSERQVTQIWQRVLNTGETLVTEDGKRLEIIYPGRPNDGPGADFRDAVISANKEVITGDVEIHVASSDWYEHGHHLNPAYNRVILHVVMKPDNKNPVILHSGRIVNVITLEKYRNIITDYLSGGEHSGCMINVPCSMAFERRDKESLLDFLGEAGEKRFLEKAERFRKDIYRMGAGQSLHRGIMGALGYSGNKRPFLELADRLSLQTLESANEKDISGEEYLNRLQLLLLGTSGLLPDRSMKNLSHIPERLQAILYSIKPMSAGNWRLYRVRPNNSPVCRLIAMSNLLLRYREKGLFEGLIGLLEDVPADRHFRTLERGLQTNALGNGRAADIIVNVLLPFAFAWSRYSGSYKLEKKSLYLYRHYPRTAVNSVERHMRTQLGLSGKMVNTAAKQQGIIYIYNNLCIQGECRNCMLGNLEVRDNVQVHPVRIAVPEPEVAAGSNHCGIVGA
jgi:hypothetical protein